MFSFRIAEFDSYLLTCLHQVETGIILIHSHLGHFTVYGLCLLFVYTNLLLFAFQSTLCICLLLLAIDLPFAYELT